MSKALQRPDYSILLLEAQKQLDNALPYQREELQKRVEVLARAASKQKSDTGNRGGDKLAAARRIELKKMTPELKKVVSLLHRQGASLGQLDFYLREAHNITIGQDRIRTKISEWGLKRKKPQPPRVRMPSRQE